MFPKDEGNVTCGEQPKTSFKKHTYTQQRRERGRKKREERSSI